MASIVRFSCKNKNIFGNLVTFEKIRVLATNRYVQTIPRNMSCVQFSTSQNIWNRLNFERKTFPGRQDWPVSNTWKRLDFRPKAEREKTSYQEMFDSLNGNTFSAYRFYLMISLKDANEPWSEAEVCNALILLSDYKCGLNKTDRLKWVHYLKDQLKKNGPVSSEVYVHVLNCYLDINHKFDPVDILNEMEESGQEPSDVVLSRLMTRYIYLGDFPAAKSIFEHVQEGNNFSLPCAGAMIMGYTMARKRYQGSYLEEHMKRGSNFTQLNHLYVPVVMGFILAGDLEGADKAEATVCQLDGRWVFNLYMIEKCASLKLTKGIDFLIDALRRKGVNTFYQRSGPTIIALIANGFYEKAYELFKLLEDGGAHLFLKCAVRGEMPPNIALKNVKRMEEDGVRNAHINQYLDILHITHDKYALHKETLLFYKQKGLQLRPQYIWPQICHCREDGTLEDLKEILPLYMLDEITDKMFLFPCLSKFGVGVEDIVDLFKKNPDLNADECKYIQCNYALFLRDNQSVVKIIGDELNFRNVRLSYLDRKMFLSYIAYLFKDNITVRKFVDKVTGGQRAQFHQMLKKENASRHEVIQLATQLRESGMFREANQLLKEAKLEPFESCKGNPADCTFFDQSLDFDRSMYNLHLLLSGQFLNTGSEDVDARMWQIQFASGVMKNFLKNIGETTDKNLYIQFLLRFLKEEDNIALALYNTISCLMQESKMQALSEVLNVQVLKKNFADTCAISLALVFFEKGDRERATRALQKCQIPYMTYLRFINMLAAEKKVKLMQDFYGLASDFLDDPLQKQDMLSIIQMYTAKLQGEAAGQKFYDKYAEELKTYAEQEL